MQTFLPFADFEASARVLDVKRLGKQRVECIQLVRALITPNHGFANHPATLMWKGYEEALGRYALAMCDVWCELGFADTCATTIAYDLKTIGIDAIRTEAELRDAGALPPWVWDERVHESHQSNLVRKDPDFYREHFPTVVDNLEYFWPVRSEKVIAAETKKAENARLRAERAIKKAEAEVEKAKKRRSQAAKKAAATRKAKAKAASSVVADEGSR